MTEPASKQTQQSQIKQLIAKGKEQGFLTYAEVNDHLPDELVMPRACHAVPLGIEYYYNLNTLPSK